MQTGRGSCAASEQTRPLWRHLQMTMPISLQVSGPCLDLARLQIRQSGVRSCRCWRVPPSSAWAEEWLQAVHASTIGTVRGLICG